MWTAGEGGRGRAQTRGERRARRRGPGGACLLRVWGEHGVERPRLVAMPVARIAVPDVHSRHRARPLAASAAAVRAGLVADDAQVVAEVAIERGRRPREDGGDARRHQVLHHATWMLASERRIVELVCRNPERRAIRHGRIPPTSRGEALPQAVPRDALVGAPPSVAQRAPDHVVLRTGIEDVPAEARRPRSQIILAGQRRAARRLLAGAGEVVVVGGNELVEHLADRPRRRRHDAERLRVPFGLEMRVVESLCERGEEGARAVEHGVARGAPLAEPAVGVGEEAVEQIPSRLAVEAVLAVGARLVQQP